MLRNIPGVAGSSADGYGGTQQPTKRARLESSSTPSPVGPTDAVLPPPIVDPELHAALSQIGVQENPPRLSDLWERLYRSGRPGTAVRPDRAGPGPVGASLAREHGPEPQRDADVHPDRGNLPAPTDHPGFARLRGGGAPRRDAASTLAAWLRGGVRVRHTQPVRAGPVRGDPLEALGRCAEVAGRGGPHLRGRRRAGDRRRRSTKGPRLPSVEPGERGRGPDSPRPYFHTAGSPGWRRPTTTDSPS